MTQIKCKCHGEHQLPQDFTQTLFCPIQFLPPLVLSFGQSWWCICLWLQLWHGQQKQNTCSVCCFFDRVINVAVTSCTMIHTFKVMLRRKVLHIGSRGKYYRIEIVFDLYFPCTTFSVNYFLCVGVSHTSLEYKFSANV